MKPLTALAAKRNLNVWSALLGGSLVELLLKECEGVLSCQLLVVCYWL
jgi:hypothetical protein